MHIRSILRALFLLGAVAALSGSRRKPRLSENDVDRASDPVDEAGEESFPASDPPGWTLGEESRAR
jgi:hypothetical protein